MSQIPSGEERKVQFIGGASIDGAPVAYIVVLAAVVAALSFIPFSVVLASGGSFPLSQGIFGLVGWVLGPIAGAIATGIGRVLGVFLAPHTAGVPVSTVYAAIVASFAAGAMVLSGKRKNWWIYLAVLFVLSLAVTIWRAIFINGVRVWVILYGTSLDTLGILLWILPTRKIFARWILEKNLGKLALGLFAGTWMIGSLMIVVEEPITYWLFNWPEEVWYTLVPLLLFEYTTRSLTGMVIGTGVIAGLRAIGIVKPTEALY